MLDLARFKDCLVHSGVATVKQFDEALNCTNAGKVSVDKALVILEVASYPEIGRCLAEVCELPYSPLLDKPPSEQASRLLSTQCAIAWKVLPTTYDPEANLLTVAVHDPVQIADLERINRFLMQPHGLAFTIAPQGEIEEALRVHLLGQKPEPAKPPHTLESGPDQRPKKKVRLMPDEERTDDDTTKGDRPVKAPEFPYADMGRALVSMASLVARTHLHDNTDRLRDIRTRARYCELLFSRLELSPIKAHGLAVAAWLSAFDDGPDATEQLATPYDLDGILFPDKTAADQQRVEARILALVKCYQELSAQDPAACKDVNLTRGYLNNVWCSSSDEQNILESFLQALMDEQFLAKRHGTAGRVLIVDPDEAATTHLASLLESNGYEVETVLSVKAAQVVIAERRPDLIISEMNLRGATGVRFCKDIKQSPATSRIPFIVLTSQDGEKHEAQCLHAGANEFLTKPVDPELLFLRIHRLIAPAETLKDGVSGALRELSFNDMIQVLCTGRRNIEITLTRDKEKGKVFIEAGNIVHACAGDTEGEEAFFQLAQWEEGNFTTRQCDNFPTHTIQSPAMPLLLEGARLADERNEANVKS